MDHIPTIGKSWLIVFEDTVEGYKIYYSNTTSIVSSDSIFLYENMLAKSFYCVNIYPKPR